MNFKLKTIVIATVSFLLSASLFTSAQTLIKGNDKVVKVNKTVITTNELEKTYSEVSKLAPVYGKNFTKKEVLQTMIDEELLRSEVKSKSIVLDENQVKQEIDAVKYQYSQMMYAQNSNFVYNENEFKAYIEKEGNMTYAKFEDKIKEKVMVKQYIMKKIEKKLMTIDQKQYPDSELRKFRNDNLSQFVQPDSVEIKHIFLRTVLGDGKTTLPDNEKQIVRKRIDDISKRLKNGESFDELCELNSEDIESRDRVNPKTKKIDRGYLGLMPVSGEAADMVKEQFGFGQDVLDKIYALGKNKFSEVIESRVGYHIFYVVDKVPERIVPYEEAKDQIINYMKMRDKENLFMEEYKNLIKELREKAEIVYYKEELKS
ncbi:MAG TPA: SurA N-terminal domain-containing protein [Spirochaetota bacterium]|nr:MAG: peptidylprolyl isomerase [Spirochaetes bacterium ADurb.Bin133]HNZ26657.1 SurA N-terminal domain-containing protein [Spirochaetota bacterium]HPY87706.1 SurA N-terminal domain-containing protein [Spirochaetota bacterium]HQB60798.1 SurA N-terminal domain-containing protein [Spirochaetota bacterium]